MAPSLITTKAGGAMHQTRCGKRVGRSSGMKGAQQPSRVPIQPTKDIGAVWSAQQAGMTGAAGGGPWAAAAGGPQEVWCKDREQRHRYAAGCGAIANCGNQGGPGRTNSRTL